MANKTKYGKDLKKLAGEITDFNSFEITKLLQPEAWRWNYVRSDWHKDKNIGHFLNEVKLFNITVYREQIVRFSDSARHPSSVMWRSNMYYTNFNQTFMSDDFATIMKRAVHVAFPAGKEADIILEAATAK